KALFTSRLRSFLTMLGIVIGVFVVITLVTIAEGAKVYIFEQLNFELALQIYSRSIENDYGGPKKG
ncbi:MAG: ABC transporter permease, partial [Candidatus Staskawiczbacteria bacterium]|nr:ABC transporter permease [Candidatus Staskawiczbacteria bacterium]